MPLYAHFRCAHTNVTGKIKDGYLDDFQDAVVSFVKTQKQDYLNKICSCLEGEDLSEIRAILSSVPNGPKTIEINKVITDLETTNDIVSISITAGYIPHLVVTINNKERQEQSSYCSTM
jgi:hypothetical protein